MNNSFPILSAFGEIIRPKKPWRIILSHDWGSIWERITRGRFLRFPRVLINYFTHYTLQNMYRYIPPFGVVCVLSSTGKELITGDSWRRKPR